LQRSEAEVLFDIVERAVDCVAVIFVPERYRPDDDSAIAACDRHLVPEFVFLMLLALADALYLGFVQRIDLVLVISLLLKDFLEQVNHICVGAKYLPAFQVPFRFTDEPSRNGSQLSVRLAGLLEVLRMVAEALVPTDCFQGSPVALSLWESFLRDDHLDLVDYLVCKLRVGRERDVLFLHACVQKDGAASLRSLIVVVVVDADAFFQDQIHAGFAYHVAEVDQFACVAGLLRREKAFAAEVLVIGVFLELLHDGFVGDVADMLQDDESRHAADGFAGCSHLFVEQFRELRLEKIPVDLVCEDVETVLVVELVL